MEKINRLSQRIEQFLIVRVVRAGLVNMIPVLMIGAFALVLRTFPVAGYQDMMGTAAGGFIMELLGLVYSATFGVLSVYMTLFICRAYMRMQADQDASLTGAAASSMIAFFILSGANLNSFSTDCMGPKSMFMAIITGLGASALYLVLFRRMGARRQRVMTRGADREFNRALDSLMPIALVAIIFALIDTIIIRVFNVESFHQMIILAFNGLFSGGGPSFLKGFCFVLLSSLLWFFGIHGSDTLEGVMQEFFTPGLAVNQASLANGMEPTHILTKQFFDCFVLMGGCGATICLLLAILFFSRNRSSRELGWAAALPMAFNINELMVFGLPIIYNPVMLIPFLVTPLVCYSIAYAAFSLGLVPVISGSVEWTTPILIGGYHATGSAAGSVLQLVNVCVGVLIYMPFVRILDKQTETESQRVFEDFMTYFRTNEEELSGRRLSDQHDVYGEFARNLTCEIHHELPQNVLLYYQPQYNYEGRCVGTEALLRWKHPEYGMLYPPLVIKLAEEGGFLSELEEAVLLRVMDDKTEVEARFGRGVKISFNVTGSTVVTERFMQFCRQWNARDPFRDKNICIEVTEQAAIAFDEVTVGKLRELHDMGLMLAIDDFSMGHTSINYLKNNLFDVIKLDGSLVKGLTSQGNCREIISSITHLAGTLHMTVIAEFVETEEQREILHEAGCSCYQGWLYSPAVPLEQPRV